MARLIPIVDIRGDFRTILAEANAASNSAIEYAQASERSKNAAKASADAANTSEANAKKSAEDAEDYAETAKNMSATTVQLQDAAVSELIDTDGTATNARFTDAFENMQTQVLAKVKDASAAVLRIDSSRGVLFKKNTLNTVLNVTVFYDGLAITDIIELHSALGDGCYLEWSWKRMDDTEFQLLSVSDHRISNGGFSLTVTADDVETKTVFMCALQI